MMFDKTITEIIDENYVYARALCFLGIDFFKFPEKKLKEICFEQDIEHFRVIRSFYLFDACHRISFSELGSHPLQLLVQYLRHTHHVFIKDRLSFITQLVGKGLDNHDIGRMMPEVIEDIIRHIYEEEDMTFKYVELLLKIKEGQQKAPFTLLSPFKNFSLQKEYEHHQNEDELAPLRSLLPLIDNSLLGRVLVSEVKAFEREMIYHAAVENKIFFPKALQLEEDTNAYLERIISLN